MNQNADVIVIGAGASGMAAAICAAGRHGNVLLLEKGEKPGRKILASGNGRCNIMNSGTPRYFGDPAFAGEVLRRCPSEEIRRFFAHYGLMLTEEEDGRIYPVSYMSSTVLSVLKTAMEASGVRLLTRTGAISISRRDRAFEVTTDSGAVFTAGRVIVTCGGAAQPKAGGSADGYGLLASLGHRIISPQPALVPLETDRKSISGLSGIRVRCTVSLAQGDRILHEEKGEVLFTDYGISGICVMQCSRFVLNGETQILLNLLDGIFPGSMEACDELKRRRQLFRSFSPVSLLDGILAAKLSYAVLKQADIPMRGETAGDLNDSDLRRIAETAFHYRIPVTGNRGIDYAQVTAGGADCSEFAPATMASLIVPGLYAAGEVLNVDGDCGGFNLMFAFSSGMIAGGAV